MVDSINSAYFSMRSYLPLIGNNSVTHGLASYLKEKELFSRKPRAFLFIFSTGFTPFNALLLFPLLNLSSSLRTVFVAISSNKDEVQSINPPPNVFVFEDFNVYHKD